MIRPRLLAISLVVALFPAVAPAEPSPGASTAISLTSTLLPCAIGSVLFVSDAPEVGWTLTAAGVLFGPASGYLYGGRPGRGFAGVGIRAGAAVVGMAGIGSMFDESSDDRGGAVVALVAAAAIAGSVAVDLALVGRDVRERNQRRAVSLVPWRSREGAPGIALRAEF